MRTIEKLLLNAKTIYSNSNVRTSEVSLRQRSAEVHPVFVFALFKLKDFYAATMNEIPWTKPYWSTIIHTQRCEMREKNTAASLRKVLLNLTGKKNQCRRQNLDIYNDEPLRMKRKLL